MEQTIVFVFSLVIFGIIAGLFAWFSGQETIAMRKNIWDTKMKHQDIESYDELYKSRKFHCLESQRKNDNIIELKKYLEGLVDMGYLPLEVEDEIMELVK